MGAKTLQNHLLWLSPLTIKRPPLLPRRRPLHYPPISDFTSWELVELRAHALSQQRSLFKNGGVEDYSADFAITSGSSATAPVASPTYLFVAIVRGRDRRLWRRMG